MKLLNWQIQTKIRYFSTKLEIAKSMLKDNIDKKIIIKHTGLTLEQIEEL